MKTTLRMAAAAAIALVLSVFNMGCEDERSSDTLRPTVQNKSSYTVTYTITNHGKQILEPGKKAVYDDAGELTVNLLGPSSVTAQFENPWLIVFLDR